METNNFISLDNVKLELDITFLEKEINDILYPTLENFRINTSLSLEEKTNKCKKIIKDYVSNILSHLPSIANPDYPDRKLNVTDLRFDIDDLDFTLDHIDWGKMLAPLEDYELREIQLRKHRLDPNVIGEQMLNSYKILH